MAWIALTELHNISERKKKISFSVTHTLRGFSTKVGLVKSNDNAVLLLMVSECFDICSLINDTSNVNLLQFHSKHSFIEIVFYFIQYDLHYV